MTHPRSDAPPRSTASPCPCAAPLPDPRVGAKPPSSVRPAGTTNAQKFPGHTRRGRQPPPAARSVEVPGSNTPRGRVRAHGAPTARPAPRPPTTPHVYTDGDGNNWWKSSVTVEFADNGDSVLADGSAGSGSTRNLVADRPRRAGTRLALVVGRRGDRQHLNRSARPFITYVAWASSRSSGDGASRALTPRAIAVELRTRPAAQRSPRPSQRGRGVPGLKGPAPLRPPHNAQ